MAGYADWIAREHFASFLLCEEEGDGGGCGSDSGSDFDLRGDRAAGDGGIDAGAAFLGDLGRCGLGAVIELLELLRVAE